MIGTSVMKGLKRSSILTDPVYHDTPPSTIAFLMTPGMSLAYYND